MKILMFLFLFYCNFVFGELPEIKKFYKYKQGESVVIEILSNIPEFEKELIRNNFAKQLIAQGFNVIEREYGLTVLLQNLERDQFISEDLRDTLNVRGVNYILLIKTYDDYTLGEKEITLAIKMIDKKSVNLIPPYEETWKLRDAFIRKEIEKIKIVEYSTVNLEPFEEKFIFSLGLDFLFFKTKAYDPLLRLYPNLYTEEKIKQRNVITEERREIVTRFYPSLLDGKSYYLKLGLKFYVKNIPFSFSLKGGFLDYNGYKVTNYYYEKNKENDSIKIDVIKHYGKTVIFGSDFLLFFNYDLGKYMKNKKIKIAEMGVESFFFYIQGKPLYNINFVFNLNFSIISFKLNLLNLYFNEKQENFSFCLEKNGGNFFSLYFDFFEIKNALFNL